MLNTAQMLNMYISTQLYNASGNVHYIYVEDRLAEHVFRTGVAYTHINKTRYLLNYVFPEKN